CFWRAAAEQSEVPVYFGELAFAAGWFYARFAVGMPQRCDAWALLVMGLGFHFAARLLERTPPFSRPLFLTSLALPLVPLLTLFAAGYTPQDQLAAALIVATFYAGIWRQSRQPWAGIVFGLLVQLAFSVHWLHAGLAFGTHLQHYLVPAGLLTLVFAQVHQAQLGRAALARVRWCATAVIYAASASDLFAAHVALGQWAFLTLLAAVGVVTGMALRLRPFFYLGTLFLVGNTLTLLGDTALDNPGSRVAILLPLGAVLIVGGAYWDRLKERWGEVTAEME
ncbi:MAG: hypothetical protein HYU66_04105, partial [Armatimonadetes bacterium]|nr:hypothetical protein [Armatimonadota bacterium]